MYSTRSPSAVTSQTAALGQSHLVEGGETVADALRPQRERLGLQDFEPPCPSALVLSRREHRQTEQRVRPGGAQIQGPLQGPCGGARGGPITPQNVAQRGVDIRAVGPARLGRHGLGERLLPPADVEVRLRRDRGRPGTVRILAQRHGRLGQGPRRIAPLQLHLGHQTPRLHFEGFVAPGQRQDASRGLKLAKALADLTGPQQLGRAVIPSHPQLGQIATEGLAPVGPLRRQPKPQFCHGRGLVGLAVDGIEQCPAGNQQLLRQTFHHRRGRRRVGHDGQLDRPVDELVAPTDPGSDLLQRTIDRGTAQFEAQPDRRQFALDLDPQAGQFGNLPHHLRDELLLHCQRDRRLGCLPDRCRGAPQPEHPNPPSTPHRATPRQS